MLCRAGDRALKKPTVQAPSVSQAPSRQCAVANADSTAATAENGTTGSGRPDKNAKRPKAKAEPGSVCGNSESVSIHLNEHQDHESWIMRTMVLERPNSIHSMVL